MIATNAWSIGPEMIKTRENILPRPERCPNLNGNWKGTCENQETREVFNASMLIVHTDCSTIKLNNVPHYPGTSVNETTSSSAGTYNQSKNTLWLNNTNGLNLIIKGSLHQFASSDGIIEDTGEISVKRNGNAMELVQINQREFPNGSKELEHLKCNLAI